MEKKSLFGKTLLELQELTSARGLKPFVAKQIADWLYKKEIESIDEMTNLSITAREILNSHYTVGLTKHTNVQVSKDGTKKYLFKTAEGKFIEAAYIPDKDRATLCISSQVGCKMGCLFCMTGKQGFQAHLTAGEIVNQIKSLPEFHSITNIVYMGMGEPFDNIDNVLKSLEIITSEYGLNMSTKRITVSTIGIIPGLKRYMEESPCHLAVSLHTPFDDERSKLMPIENVYPISEVLKEIKSFDFGKQRRVSFEYIMFKGLNDTPRHIKELVKILNGIRCRVNLIRFHPIPGTPLVGSDYETMLKFRDALTKKGVTCTIRGSRGEDIFAACGLLSTKELSKNSEK